jgi:hypothetical protein
MDKAAACIATGAVHTPHAGAHDNARYFKFRLVGVQLPFAPVAILLVAGENDLIRGAL